MTEHEQIKAILDNIPFATALISSAGVVSEANRAWLRGGVLDSSPHLTPAIGSDFIKALHDIGRFYEVEDFGERQSLADLLYSVLRGEEESVAFTLRGSDQGGGSRWFQFWSRAVKIDGRGASLGAVVGYGEITSQRLLERQLIREKQHAVDESRRKGLFLANLSHELRTPLNAIIGFADLLRSQTFGPISHPKYLHFARSIYEGAEHLYHIVERILNMARIQSGSAHVHMEAVPVENLFSKALMFVRAQFSNRRILADLDQNLSGYSVDCDEALMTQVIVNLLINALKFSGPNKEVLLQARLDDHGQLRFAIQDWGVGMDEVEIEIARKVFGQNPNPLQDETGLGLGLPFSIFIVELHKGELKIQSQKGVGTLVEVAVPSKGALGLLVGPKIAEKVAIDYNCGEMA